MKEQTLKIIEESEIQPGLKVERVEWVGPKPTHNLSFSLWVIPYREDDNKLQFSLDLIRESDEESLDLELEDNIVSSLHVPADWGLTVRHFLRNSVHEITVDIGKSLCSLLVSRVEILVEMNESREGISIWLKISDEETYKVINKESEILEFLGM